MEAACGRAFHRAAKRRAEQRVERFLDAAQEIVAEKGTTDFTVQEVVDRSMQSLRSFHQHFDGKHELLPALFEDAMSTSGEECNAPAAAEQAGPLDRLKVVVQELFESSHPGPSGRQRPLFTDFALRLLVSHPAETRVANAPLLALIRAGGGARGRPSAAFGLHGAPGGRGDPADGPVQRPVERAGGGPPAHRGRDLGLLRERPHARLTAREPTLQRRRGLFAGRDAHRAPPLNVPHAAGPELRAREPGVSRG